MASRSTDDAGLSKHMLKKRDMLANTVKSCFFTLALILSCLGITIYAQTGPSTPTPVPTEADSTQVKDSANRPSDKLTNNPPPPSEATTEYNYLTSREFILAILLTVVSLFAFSMQFILLKKIPKLKPEDTLRSLGVVLIIMGTLFVIAAGFNSIQIAPAMGLFGTIAGYLLGRVEKKEDEKND